MNITNLHLFQYSQGSTSQYSADLNLTGQPLATLSFSSIHQYSHLLQNQMVSTYHIHQHDKHNLGPENIQDYGI